MNPWPAPGLWQYVARALAGSDALDVFWGGLEQHSGIAGRSAGRYVIYIDAGIADRAKQLHILCHEAAHIRCGHVADGDLSAGAPAVNVPLAERELIALTEYGPDVVRALIADHEEQAEQLAKDWLTACDRVIGNDAPIDEKLLWLYKHFTTGMEVLND